MNRYMRNHSSFFKLSARGNATLPLSSHKTWRAMAMSETHQTHSKGGEGLTNC